MIKVIVNNNAKAVSVDIDENTTLRECIEAQGSNYSSCVITLNGCYLEPGDLDRTFASFGYDGTYNHDKCYLTRSAKRLSKEDFTSNEAYLAYKHQQEENRKRTAHLLDVVEGQRKTSFVWKAARTVSLTVMAFLMSQIGSPWYHYIVLLITAWSWGLSEVFAE